MPPGIPPIPSIPPMSGALVLVDAIISSIRSIISAASAADCMACFLTLLGSITPASFMSVTSPVNTFSPMYGDFSCADLKSTNASILSRPAFSASVLGTTSNAAANAPIASCSLPLMVSAYSLSPLAMAISGAPPPATTLPSSTVAATTPIASSTALSTSSATCLVLPLSMIETALGSTQSSTNRSTSSKIFFSYTCPAIPRSSACEIV